MQLVHTLDRPVAYPTKMLPIFLAGSILFGCFSRDVSRDERTSELSSAMVGTTDPDPPNSGIVFITAPALQQDGMYRVDNGTGTFIDDDWILTADHVVSHAASPMDVEIRRGNRTDLGAEVRHGRRIVSHPQWDVALVQLEQPFTVSSPRTLSNLSQTDIVQKAQVRCFGYGRGGVSCPPTDPPGTLRFAEFTPVADSSISFKAFPTNNAALWSSDSGGPCIDVDNPSMNEILGVMTKTALDCSANEGFVIAVGAFRDWANLVKDPLTLFTVNGDFDLDGKDDVGGLKYLSGGLYVIEIHFANGTTQQLFLPLVLPPPDPMIADAAQLYIGNFGAGNGNDITALVNETLLYFDGGQDLMGQPTLTPHAGFVAVSSTYRSLVVQDSNNDGLDDVEAILPDGTRDLYFGSPTGLVNGSHTEGMPSANGTDGKFMALVSRGSAELATPANSLSSFQISVDGTQQGSFAIQIFDGDDGFSSWDIGETGGAVTCYDLYSSPNGFNIDHYEFSVKSTDLADNAWSTLYEGPNLGQPDAGGTYYYIVDARIEATGDCTMRSGEPANAFVNSFKIRATGLLFAYEQDLAFVGFDVFGDWALPLPVDTTLLRDTTYDGSFVFYSAVSDAGKELIFRNADADVAHDDPVVTDPANPLYKGPLDEQADGKAVGKSDTVQYSIYDPNGVLVHTDLNPSGNNDGVNDFDEEQYVVKTAGVAGLWKWEWSGIFAHNDIRIWVPVGSPLAYPMFSERSPLPRVSSAQPLLSWLTATIPNAYLPISLGSGLQTFTVPTSSAAGNVLNQKYAALGGAPNNKTTLCHRAGNNSSQYHLATIGNGAMAGHIAHGDDVERPSLVSRFAAELLTAKLNVAAATQGGEHLLNGYIYGTDMMDVAHALTAADAIFVQGDDICRLIASDQDLITRLTDILRAINAGAITYNPVSPGRATMNLMAAPAPIPQAGGAATPLAPL